MKNLPRWLAMAMFFISQMVQLSTQIAACSSKIYCQGPLLDLVQTSNIFDDSKTFVDMKLKQSPETVLDAFDMFMASNNARPNSSEVQQFVNEYFDPPGSEFQDFIPVDWKESPAFLANIVDHELRDWARELHALWKDLGRKMVQDVLDNAQMYSIIAVDNPVIVPGGRFREFYYWDTYWIIRGLLLSEMYDTAKGMLENFLNIVDNFGFVPNGGRIYYTKRSQPPFLALMIFEYYSVTTDQDFLRRALPSLDREYAYWTNVMNVSVDGFELSHYSTDIDMPRPESYREDNEIAGQVPDEQSPQLLRQIAATCASGWDFSSRWAPSYKGGSHSTADLLKQLTTTEIIPVDLNSILATNEKLLSSFHAIVGDESSSAIYEEKYGLRVQAIEDVLWNETERSYFDYLQTSREHLTRYYLSNLNLLWTKSYPTTVSASKRDEDLFHYLQQSGALSFPGGIPTSLEDTGQQWDFPNAWPPLVHMAIEGLAESSVKALQSEAFVQAQKWVTTNYRAYKKTKAMFEKYDVTATDGVAGSGGEYDVQKGFGWTNGVILSLLDRYGSSLQAPTDSGNVAELRSLPVIFLSVYLGYLLQ